MARSEVLCGLLRRKRRRTRRGVVCVYDPIPKKLTLGPGIRRRRSRRWRGGGVQRQYRFGIPKVDETSVETIGGSRELKGMRAVRGSFSVTLSIVAKSEAGNETEMLPFQKLSTQILSSDAGARGRRAGADERVALSPARADVQTLFAQRNPTPEGIGGVDLNSRARNPSSASLALGLGTSRFPSSR